MTAKKFRYLVEGFFVSLLIGLFRILPLDTASAIGGFIGHTIGPHLSSNRKMRRNIEACLPGKTKAEYDKIIWETWDNLGRTFSEYPHLHKIAKERVTLIGAEHIQPVIEQNLSCIMFTGHLANWEISGAYAHKLGIRLDLIYRAPNNPYVEGILQSCRSMEERITTHPKSAQGMRQVFAALKAGRSIGILIDQKYNQGIAMPFFGRTAMTSPAFAQLAQKFDCPLFPARVERLKGANFRLTMFPPMEIQGRTVEDIITESHIMLEQWITERPGQWLWLHNRWKNKNVDRL